MLEVAVAVIEREGRFLITQRLPNDSFAGLWEFPGGKIHAGESAEQALVREIREELGVAVSVGAKRMEIEHAYPARVVRLHCFDCRLAGGEPRAIQCAAWRWVLPSEMAAFQFLPASRPLIESLLQGSAPAPHGA